jgi:hypothetical protein
MSQEPHKPSATEGIADKRALFPLDPFEFVISLDGEPSDLFKTGGSLGLTLRNPHAPLEFDAATLAMLKVLVRKMAQGKTAKPVPSDIEIKAAIRKVKMDYINSGKKTDFDVELFKVIWEQAQS